MPSKDSNNLTNTKEERHPRSFQNPLNVALATNHTIHQSTNSDHAKDATELFTAEENAQVKHWKERITDTKRTANNPSTYIHVYNIHT